MDSLDAGISATTLFCIGYTTLMLALKLDGMSVSWVVVFLPVWLFPLLIVAVAVIAVSVSALCNAFRTFFEKED